MPAAPRLTSKPTVGTGGENPYPGALAVKDRARPDKSSISDYFSDRLRRERP
jgi:hypothetical protein